MCISKLVRSINEDNHVSNPFDLDQRGAVSRSIYKYDTRYVSKQSQSVIEIPGFKKNSLEYISTSCV